TVRGLMALGFLCLSSIAAACNFSPNVFSNLDYGLYWYGYSDSCEKAIPGQANPYFNPDHKTVIYIHGWQNGSTPNLTRETFNASANGGPDMPLADYWISKGYNVGILYWNQFADESEVKDAEAKIWSTQGPKGMRWRDSSGNYHSGPGKSVTQLLYEAFRDNMQGYNGSYIRIAGHSLGNQLAVTLTKKIYDEADAGHIAQNLKPQRVALLDPFYSNYAKSYLNNQWTGEVARNDVADLKSRGLIVEAYRSSSVSSTYLVGDENKGLLNMAAFSQLKPWYFASWQQAEKHISARWWYFWSFAFAPPPIDGSNSAGESASTGDNRIKQLMNGNQGLQQNSYGGGAYTKSPDDDSFHYTNRL
ncbi:MAG: hypothetical protein R3303_12385, partial [Marinobacter sp.]|nr:hypothetical protein [Marinobacter sp.]